MINKFIVKVEDKESFARRFNATFTQVRELLQKEPCLIGLSGIHGYKRKHTPFRYRSVFQCKNYKEKKCQTGHYGEVTLLQAIS